MSGHTPTPWQAHNDYTREGRTTIIANVDGEQDAAGWSYSYDTICRCEDEYGEQLAEAEANAALIVKAVNAHDVLIEALEEVLRYRRGEGKYRFAGLPADERECAMFDAWQEVEAQVVNALSLARSEGGRG